MRGWIRTCAAAIIAAPLALVLLVGAIGGGAATQAETDNGDIDVTQLPALAARVLPHLRAELAQQCPDLPPVWVVGQAMQESSWNPRAWADDRNGGTAGLLQINEDTWRELGGQPWDSPPHRQPPPNHGIWDSVEHISRGVELNCRNLDTASDWLSENDSGLSPIEGMLVCHNAGCGRLSNPPRSTVAYIDQIHSYVRQYTGNGRPPAPRPGPDTPLPDTECVVDELVTRTNPRDCSEAIDWAAQKVDEECEWSNRCLGFVGHAYGWAASGEYSAWTHWQRMQADGLARTDTNPPIGALLYWKGSGPYGHVALYLGDGKIASNDIRRPGCIDIVAWDAPETDWGQRYLGWSPPQFPNGVGSSTSLDRIPGVQG